MSASRDIAPLAARTLHQFPRSHFCEKVRWHLDLKGLDYQVRNLFPGTHARVNRRLVGQSSVPLLIDGGQVIHSSSTIALHLERTYPGPPRLLPEDDGLRALVLALQAYFDNTVGPAIRQWTYGHLLKKRGLAARTFFRGYPRSARWMGRLIAPIFERQLARTCPSDDAALMRTEQIVIDGVERLENTIERNPSRYLVGSQLTLADVTAAALLAPLVAPPGSPWSVSDPPIPVPAIASMRARMRSRPAGEWVLQLYARDRRPRLSQHIDQTVAQAAPSTVIEAV